MSLAAYATEYSIPQLTANQLDIVGKVITALSPIEEITKAVSANAASVSLIIQFVRMLSKTMEKHQDDKGVQTMKSEMLASLKRMFSDTEKNKCLVIATLIDPRFKDKFFSGPVKELLPDKCWRKRRKNWVKQEKAGLLNNLLQSDHAPTCGKAFQKSWKRQVQVLQISGQRLILISTLGATSEIP